MSRVKKKVSAFAVIEMLLIVLLILVMAAMLAFNFLFKRGEEPLSLFGMSFYITKSDNMQTEIPKNTFIIAKKSEIPNISEGSVVLCRIGKIKEYTALMRVQEIKNDGEKISYVVNYDINENDPSRAITISSDEIIAKAVRQSKWFGVFLNFATSTPGIIIAVIIPLIFIIAIQVARILSIRKLEEEAASLDDIDGFIASRDEESPAAVTFTEPKFVEDVTGKIPPVSPVSPVIRNVTLNPEPKPVPEKILSVDGSGRAEYVQRKPEDTDNSPLFTYDRLRAKEPQKMPVTVGAAAVSKDELYLNKPTRIEGKSSVDEFFEKYAPKPETAEIITETEESKPVIFTPHLSNVIPDSIAAVQEQTEAPRKSGFDESVKSYYEKSREKTYVPMEEKPAENAGEEISTIPENAVRPKETLAPPVKKKSSKALEELMSIIDAEETKLKK